ncbi:MAG: YwaF family protein [Clostridia bacterium]|nr:YwaF family protein [Clostridia bacterium]
MDKLFFNGDYSFFEYKYNISGYDGQDFGGAPQYVYLAVSFVAMAVILFALRKLSKDKVRVLLRVIGIFMILFYLTKTAWETVYDIGYDGEFNKGLLPFDTCSLIMQAALLAGFGKGKIKKIAECWLMTGCIIGGIANMLFLNAFKYYPFWSFGAFYSMTWHFIMVFTGLLLYVADYTEQDYSVVLYGFLFQVAASLIAIPLDFMSGYDFMLYRDLGGVPVFESVADRLTAQGLGFLNPLLMTELYFAAFNLIFFIILGVRYAVREAAKCRPNRAALPREA